MLINEAVNPNPDLISRLRPAISRRSPFANELSAIRRELRHRRKSFLGSSVSLMAIVCSGFGTKEETIDELSKYLASRTILFWRREVAAEKFCLRFYNIALYAITSGNVGSESVDDIVQLAECLIRSRPVFIDVVKKLLPNDMIADLFLLTEAPEDYYSALFEDAVLGAISVFLGALEDPSAHRANISTEEGK